MPTLCGSFCAILPQQESHTGFSSVGVIPASYSDLYCFGDVKDRAATSVWPPVVV
jgi:hypothetical protein